MHSDVLEKWAVRQKNCEGAEQLRYGKGVSMNKTSFIATGDAFITRRFPEGGYEGFQAVRDCIMEHDVKFSNLEMTFHNHEGYPAAFSGGTWAMADPRTLDDMKSYGFNLYNTANNHSCDYSHGGVLATIRNLNERDMIFAGTGKDLGNASKPCYLETKHARIALIGTSSSFHESGMAGGQSADMMGRPGLNPLRHVKIYHVTKKYYDQLAELAALTKVNASTENSIKNGYKNPPPEGMLMFGKYRFKLDEKNWIESRPNETDMARIEREIREARKQADVVLVSVHAHQTDAEDTKVPAMFLETFARRCVDAGADVIIGHGPHELRGIEIYKGKPIFYSLGNFLFETETVDLQPYDAYLNKKMPLDTKVGTYMDVRSKNGTAGYGVLPEIWFSVMASWEMEDGVVKEIKLYPISLGMERGRSQKGVPVMTGDENVLKYLAELSEPYGTKIEIENGVGSIRLG